jgi:hypothetical protein
MQQVQSFPFDRPLKWHVRIGPSALAIVTAKLRSPLQRGAARDLYLCNPHAQQLRFADFTADGNTRSGCTASGHRVVIHREQSSLLEQRMRSTR